MWQILNKLIAVTVLVYWVAGCSAARVSTDYETVYDFSALKTFYVLPADEKIYDNPKVSQLDVRRLEQLVPQQLAQRYQAVEKSEADFWVRYFLVVEEKMRVDSYNANFGFYRFGFGHRYGFGYGFDAFPDVTNSYYQQGSVIIDVIDAKTEDVVWRGVTEGRVNKSDKPDQRRDRMGRKIERVFSMFPPKPAAAQ